MSDCWLKIIEIIGMLGDVWSFISIIIVLGQWITNRQLKSQIKAVFNGTENTFDSIINEAVIMSDVAPGDYDSKTASVRAHAERGKDQITNARNSILK